MTSRVFRPGWPWMMGAPLLAALGAALLTAVAYRESPTVAAALVVVLAGGAAVLAYPMLGIHAGVLCAPLEYLDLKVGAVGLTAGEAVLLVAAASVLLRMLIDASAVRTSVSHVAFAVLIAISAVGVVFAPDYLVVLKIVLMWSAFLLLSIHVASATPDQLRWLFVAIAVSGSILALLAVTSGQTIELRGGGATATNRAQASFAHPAVLAFFLVLALPCAICLSLADRAWLRPPMLLASGVILAGLMLTLTRGAIIGAAVSLVVLLWLPRFRLLATALLVALLIFGATNLAPILNSPQASVVATRLSTVTGSEIHTNPRLRIYRGAPEMVIEHPLFGIGAGNFSKVSPLYGLRDLGGDTFEHAHDLPLTIAVETGLFGLAALLVFLAGLGWEATAILARRRVPGFTLAMAPVAAIAGLLASAITDYPLRTNLIMALFMIQAGALIAYARAARGSRSTADEPMQRL